MTGLPGRGLRRSRRGVSGRGVCGAAAAVAVGHEFPV